jgi:diguanylate cyclase (GGDEF)-like protein
MQGPALPTEEIRRIAALQSLNILDTDPEERFDRVTRLARSLFDVPIALVSLVDCDRQWFKSRQGLDATETPRDISFCGHSILGDDVFVVEDASKDERFADNPLVTGAPDIRFYAGCPVRSADGFKLGTLCLIDREPRKLTEEQLGLVRDLAAMIESELASLTLASVDSLTGLSNRMGFDALARHCLATAKRTDRPVTLLQFDLDGFKELNDSHGHQAGDEALADFGTALLSAFRESDVVARLGGDEFVVLMSAGSDDQVARPLAAVDEALDRRVDRGAPEVGYSVGVCTFDTERHDSVAALLAEADKRMYQHKRGKQD